MKKTLAMIMALAMLSGSLCACGSSGASSSDPPAAETKAVTEAAAKETTTEVKTTVDEKKELREQQNALLDETKALMIKGGNMTLQGVYDQVIRDDPEYAAYYKSFYDLTAQDFFTIAGDKSYIKIDSDPTNKFGLKFMGPAIAKCVNLGLGIPESFGVELEGTENTYGVKKTKYFSTDTGFDVKVEYSVDDSTTEGMIIVYYLTSKI